MKYEPMKHQQAICLTTVSSVVSISSTFCSGLFFDFL